MTVDEEGFNALMEEQRNRSRNARKASDDRIADRVKTIEDSGTEILTIDEETYNAIVDASADVRESIHEKVDSEVYDTFIECIDKIRQ